MTGQEIINYSLSLLSLTESEIADLKSSAFVQAALIHSLAEVFCSFDCEKIDIQSLNKEIDIKDSKLYMTVCLSLASKIALFLHDEQLHQYFSEQYKNNLKRQSTTDTIADILPSVKE